MITKSNNYERYAGSVSSLIMIIGWIGLSYGKVVSRLILPTPTAVIKAFGSLWIENYLFLSFLASIFRIVAGMGLAVLFCFVMGILMGTFPAIKSFFTPLLSQNRYLPVAALVPLFIVWFGIGDMMKIMLLFIGITFYLLPLIVDAVEQVSKVLVEVAYTLKASKWNVIRFVIIPLALPEIVQKVRVVTALSWTYLIIAEMINAQYGLGQLIYTASKYSRTDQVFAVLTIILFIGVLWDKILSFLYRTFFKWKINEGISI